MKKTSKRTVGSRKRSPARRERPPQEAALVAFAALAKRDHLRWYVFGAQAVNLLGFPRTTADLDLTVELGDLTLRTFLAHLRAAGFEARFTDEAFVAAARVIPVVHRTSGMPIDIVLAGPGLEEQFLDEVETHKVGRTKIFVISPENLIVTKVLAGRPRDIEDVRQLVARRDDIDHRKIEAVLDAIEDALGQFDLRPLYDRLRAAAKPG